MTLRKALHIIFWVFIGWCFLQSLLPTTGGDPCRTILYASKRYMMHGSIYYLPYVRFIQGFETLNLILMHIKQDPNSILSTMFMMLTGITLYDMGKRYFGGFAGELAAILYVTIPISRICSFYALNEHMMVFFLLLALNSVIRYREKFVRYPSSKRLNKNLILAGLFLGFAAGVDYNALIPAFVIIALAGVRGSYITLPIAALVAFPWYIINIIHFGNPVHPYHAEWFSVLGPGMHCMIEFNLYKSELNAAMDIAPHRYEFSFLLWLAIPLYPLIKNTSARNILFIFIAVMGMYWLWVEQLIHARYWLPLLAAMSLLAGAGITKLRFGPAIATPLITLYMLFFTITTVPMLVAFDGQSRYDYLVREKPGIRAISYMNHLYPDSRIYVAGLQDYRYYCDFEITGSMFGPDNYTDLMKADDMWQWLTDRDCDFILLTSGDIEEFKLRFNTKYWRWHGVLGPIQIYELLEQPE